MITDLKTYSPGSIISLYSKMPIVFEMMCRETEVYLNEVFSGREPSQSIYKTRRFGYWLIIHPDDETVSPRNVGFYKSFDAAVCPGKHYWVLSPWKFQDIGLYEVYLVDPLSTSNWSRAVLDSETRTWLLRLTDRLKWRSVVGHGL